MEVIPAIDLRSGRCVRLYQGDYRQETVYSDDPLAVALAWQRQGAPRLHLVDLDGAAQGRLVNLEVIASIIKRVEIPLQVGGGLRTEQSVNILLDLGVDRVVLGTAAVEDQGLVESLCGRHGGERVVVAVDALDGRVAIKGWGEVTSVSALALALGMKALGVQRLLYTDIARDGTMTGPNLAATAELVQETGLKILASGGVSKLDHLRQLAVLSVEGVLVGTALYTGAIKLPEALAVARASATG